MTHNRALTPEYIPSTEAQAEALALACDGLVGRSPFGRPISDFYDENYVVTFPPLIDRHFSELPRESDLTATIGHLGLNASIDRGHIRKTGSNDFFLTLQRMQKIANGQVYLSSIVHYEIGRQDSHIERTLDYDVFTNSPVHVVNINQALAYSEQHDPTLYRELRTLEDLADRSTTQDRMARITTALISPQTEERDLGLFAVPFAEADELIDLINGIE